MKVKVKVSKYHCLMLHFKDITWASTITSAYKFGKLAGRSVMNLTTKY